MIEQALVTQQLLAVQAHGQIAQGLIAAYRALGGGWEIRLGGDGPAAPQPEAMPPMPNPPEQVPYRSRPSPDADTPSDGATTGPSNRIPPPTVRRRARHLSRRWDNPRQRATRVTWFAGYTTVEFCP